jgi:hypothetical protein
MKNAKILDINFDGNFLILDTRVLIPKELMTDEFIGDVLSSRNEMIDGCFSEVNPTLFLKYTVDIEHDQDDKPVVKFHKNAVEL